MRIEIDENWLVTFTSGEPGEPGYHHGQVQFGVGKVPYTADLDGNTPMSAAELMAKGGQVNMLEGRTITLNNFKPGDDGHLPRDCWFKVADEWFSGTLHMWGTDGTDLGSYPIGVVEDDTGKVHSLYVETIKMVRP